MTVWTKFCACAMQLASGRLAQTDALLSQMQMCRCAFAAAWNELNSGSSITMGKFPALWGVDVH